MLLNCSSCCLPKRYIVSILVLIGSMLLALLQTNLSISLIEMTSDKNVTVGNETHVIKAEFNWSSVEKGYILSSFSLGLLFTFLGGFVVNSFGGATSLGVSTLVSAAIAILSPLLLKMNLWYFLVGRAVQGIFTEIGFVGITDTFAHWSPPAERTRMVSLYFVGYYLGAGINYPFSGMVAYRLGWRAVFYLSGAIAFVWSLIWLIVVANDPADDKCIKKTEKEFLKNEIANVTNEKVPIPWKKILTSKPVWAFFNEYFTVYWCSSFVLYCLPLYVKDMYNVNTEQVGLITGLPIACSLIMTPIAAYVADHLRTNHFTPAKVHKIFIFWGNVFVVILLFLTSMWTNFIGSVICFCLMRISYSFPDSSYCVISIDMGGQFSGVIKGISLTCSGLSTFLNPLVMGYMVSNHSPSEYNRYFLLLGFISMYGVIVFMRYGSGELQEWAVLPNKEENSDSNTARYAVTSSPCKEVTLDSERR